MEFSADMSVSGTNLEGVVDAKIITLEEEMAGRVVEEFKSQVASALEDGQVQLILDCKNLRFLNSEGLEAFLWVIEEVERAGGLIKIASLGKIPQKIFELTQFNRIFEIYDDVLAALKNF